MTCRAGLVYLRVSILIQEEFHVYDHFLFREFNDTHVIVGSHSWRHNGFPPQPSHKLRGRQSMLQQQRHSHEQFYVLEIVYVFYITI